jgi:hypothetical protein
LVQTACFALSNLARGPNAHLEEFFEAGIAPKLASHLINNTVSIKLFMLHNNMNAFSLIYSYYYQPDTVTEICWVLSYLTAGTDQFIGKLLDEGIAPLLVRSLIHLLLGSWENANNIAFLVSQIDTDADLTGAELGPTAIARSISVATHPYLWQYCKRTR